MKNFLGFLVLALVATCAWSEEAVVENETDEAAVAVADVEAVAEVADEEVVAEAADEAVVAEAADEPSRGVLDVAADTALAVEHAIKDEDVWTLEVVGIDRSTTAAAEADGEAVAAVIDGAPAE